MAKLKWLCMSMIAVLLFGIHVPSSQAEGNTEQDRITFSIPANTFCDASHRVELSLNITNLSKVTQKVRLDLLRVDGTEFTGEGTAYNGIATDLLPGSSIEVEAGKTATYHLTFGGQTSACSDRPFVGSFSSDSTNEAVFVASGFVSGTLGSVPILMNTGGLWNTAPMDDGGELPGPDPEPEPEKPARPPIDACSIPASNSLIPSMTSTSDVYGKASSSSYDKAWDAQAWRAFDNSCSPFSTANLQKTGWLEYEFNTAKTVNKYSILMKVNDAHAYVQSPKSWVFEAYDGTKWVTLDTQTNVNKWEQLVYNEYPFTNTTAYHKYRIRFTENNGGNLICIAELGMMGY